MVKLTDIDTFGGTAAEDDDIKRFFVRTPVFDDLIRGQRHVVIGRKGSGKTALYLALDDYAKSTERLSKGLTFKQYPWQAHYKYASNEVESKERYVASWTFLILIEAWQLISTGRSMDLDRKQRDALKSVKTFIKNNYGQIGFDFKKAFPAGGFNLDQINFSPSAQGYSAGTAEMHRNGESLGSSLERVNDWLIEKLRVLGPQVHMTYLLFDELDLGFDPNNEEYIYRVIGLLIATREFVKSITRNGIKVHPIVFLRSDIFDQLRFGDKNKILNAEVVQLIWHDNLDHDGSSLKHLLDWRIKEALNMDSIDRAWDSAFDSQLMRGTQHKFQHITFRSYLRPRDVIHFSNLALREAKKRVGKNPVGARIENQDIKAARPDYSKYLRLELDDEIAEAEPDWSNMMEVLRTVGAAKFSSSQFHSAFISTAQRVQQPKTEAETLAFMYLYSIIGFERAITGVGIEHHFRYLDESVSFESDARTFLVHRGLKESLGLSET